MPKLIFKKDEEPIKSPKFSAKDIKVWLAKTEEKEVDGKKVTVPENVSAKVQADFQNAEEISKEVDGKNRIVALKSKNLIAEILDANTKIDDKMYTDEYVNLRALTSVGAALLIDGQVNVKYNDEEKEVPSVCKYFNQGYGILSRNAAAARIRTDVEGPDKALEASARDLARARGWSFEKALGKIKAIAAED